MMYQDIYNCICQNTNKMKIYYPLCQTYSPTVVQKLISKRWTNMQEALKPSQGGCHFVDSTFKWILYASCCIFIPTWQKYVPNGAINSKPVLVQVMIWRQTSGVSLSEPVYLCIYAPLDLSKLMQSSLFRVIACSVSSHYMHASPSLNDVTHWGPWSIHIF